MKFIEIKILFKSGVKENYIIKDYNLDYGHIKEFKNLITNAIKNELIGTIEVIKLENGFETIVNLSDITAFEVGTIQNC